MTTLWLPGVTQWRSDHNGGSMTGGPPRWVWHTYECDYSVSALAGARALKVAGNEVHFVFNPITGDIVQLLPLNVAGRGLVNAAGGVETNRAGAYCIQVEVIARAARPWTRDLTPAGRAGLAKLMALADALAIPRRWPAGPPPAYPGDHNPRSMQVWTTQAGHYGHSQVPENSHGDPGALDVSVLFAAPAADTPPTQKDELDVQVKNPVTGKPWDAADALWSIWTYVLQTRDVSGKALATSQATLAAVKALADAQGQDGAAIVKVVEDAVDKALSGLTIELKTPPAPGA